MAPRVEARQARPSAASHRRAPAVRSCRGRALRRASARPRPGPGAPGPEYEAWRWAAHAAWAVLMGGLASLGYGRHAARAGEPGGRLRGRGPRHARDRPRRLVTQPSGCPARRRRLSSGHRDRRHDGPEPRCRPARRLAARLSDRPPHGRPPLPGRRRRRRRGARCRRLRRGGDPGPRRRGGRAPDRRPRHPPRARRPPLPAPPVHPDGPGARLPALRARGAARATR